MARPAAEGLLVHLAFASNIGP